MKRSLLVAIALLFMFSAFAEATPKIKVTQSPKKVGPGDLFVVTVSNATGTIDGTFDGKELFFYPAKKGFKAIVAVDLLKEPGKYALDINAGDDSVERIITVTKKKYPVQRLTLPKDMVELTPENEARAERESKVMAAIWPNQTGRIWSGDFINPRPGEISTKFGLKRIINDIPKSPHTGVDIAANEGDPVKAPNSGKVVLVDNHFFSGNSIVLDHGQGIYTMFFHLSKQLVVPGQQVKKGDVIGLVGSTGRSTGAHLHWGARVMGARVDPTELFKLKLD
jgi:murein DD-endopeptidase MepM/ murein hydrolase activator NlpD